MTHSEEPRPEERDDDPPSTDADSLAGPPESAGPAPESGEAAKPGDDSGRREFIRRTGKLFFSLTILGSFAGAPRTAPGAEEFSAGCVIGWGSTGDPDKPCAPPPNYSPDSRCGWSTPGWGTPSTFDDDEGCHINSSPGGSSVDADQGCGVQGDADHSCGDCDDNHDTDDHCGRAMADGRTLDCDELCGHAHFVGGNGDQRCNKPMTGGGTSVDEGCGVHDTVYNTWSDEDQNCGQTLPGGGTDPDNNCAYHNHNDANCVNNANGDQTCGQNPPAYASSPDESCSATSTDEACGQAGGSGYNPAYDEDASCGLNSSADESCGSSAGWFTDGDENAASNR